MKVSVILPTAGLGTRMGKSGRKQFLVLDDAPIFLHTARKFTAVGDVSEIIIAVRPEDRDWVAEIVRDADLPKPVRVVEGGDTRQESVERAFYNVDPSTDLVAVHDAVRPFIDLDTIFKVFAEAAANGAAIVGIVPVDTVKQVGKVSGNRAQIRGTLPRERLVLAQTPQVFRYDLLKRALASARADGFTGTDESSLVERLEEAEISVVLGSDRNIKITKPSDMDLARLYAREEQQPA